MEAITKTVRKKEQDSKDAHTHTHKNVSYQQFMCSVKYACKKATHKNKHLALNTLLTYLVLPKTQKATFGKHSGVHMCFSNCTDTILNWTETVLLVNPWL